MHVIIIGNGISGITAAITLRKHHASCQITVISDETEYFIARTALMYAFMGHIRHEHLKPYEDWFWHENRINLKWDLVLKILPENKSVLLKSGEKLRYDKLLLATGSRPRTENWPGQHLQGVQHLHSYQDLLLMQKQAPGVKEAVITGGGLVGVEMAEMLRTRGVAVTMLVRESHYYGNLLPKEEAGLVAHNLNKHGVQLQFNTELRELQGDATGKLRYALTSTGEALPCQFAGLAIGVKPHTTLAEDSGIETRAGILVNEYLETSVADIYAAGDCAEFRTAEPQKPAVEQLWYTGRAQGKAVGLTLAGKKTKYMRGIWFNSAKFFDLEYQMYGTTGPQPAPDEQTLYWQHPKDTKSIRINYCSATKAVNSISSLGLRLRQETCETWIRNKKTLEEVLQAFPAATFDPEFHPSYQSALIELAQGQKQGKLKSWFSKLF